MSFKCLLGMHAYGLPKTHGDGTLTHECMNCLHVNRSSLLLTHEKGASDSLNARRKRAIADLVAEERWVGTPSNPQLSPEIAPVSSREVDAVPGKFFPRPQAA